jgi:hypothetical protein
MHVDIRYSTVDGMGRLLPCDLDIVAPSLARWVLYQLFVVLLGT